MSAGEHKTAETLTQADQQASAKLFSAIGNQATSINATDEDSEGGTEFVDKIESMCMNCEKNGITRILLTKIPFFKEIILMSFYCDHCDFKSTEVDFAGEIQKQGVKYKFKVEHVTDLQRQVIKSDNATVRFEEVDVEIPTGYGRLTNIEGLISTCQSDLARDQDRRKTEHPRLYEQLEELIGKLQNILDGKSFPFTLTLNDPAGNSSLEPSPNDGNKYVRSQYARTPVQNASLGLNAEQADAVETPKQEEAIEIPVDQEGVENMDILEGKMYTMTCNCPGCSKPAAMNMQMVNIPFFKQVIITAVVCTFCDYRTNEVKTGGEIPEKGKRITLEVSKPDDLKRDILKSEHCLLKVPECNVEVQPGSMGGKFTTVEGLLTQMREDLHASIFDTDDENLTAEGDSMPSSQKTAWQEFFDQLDKAIRGEFTYTIIMEDPLGNSYVQNPNAPVSDPQIQEEEYERTEEEEEDLGLTDMRTHMNEEGEYVKEEISGKKTEDDESADASLSSATADLSLSKDETKNFGASDINAPRK